MAILADSMYNTIRNCRAYNLTETVGGLNAFTIASGALYNIVKENFITTAVSDTDGIFVDAPASNIVSDNIIDNTV